MMIAGEPISGGPISADPWVKASAAGLNASLSVTQAGDSCSGSAAVIVTATLAKAQAGDTCSASIATGTAPAANHPTLTWSAPIRAAAWAAPTHPAIWSQTED